MTFLNESEISDIEGCGGAYLSCAVDTPLAIRSCIIFNNSGGSISSVALIVNRTICTINTSQQTHLPKPDKDRKELTCVP